MNNTDDKKIRLRFAPSPTGYLHIGGARTALYNYLFAKKNNGSFILRIEDTDEARSTDESMRAIVESMDWLGLKWDEGPQINSDGKISEIGSYGPYFQMRRLDIYKKYALQLIDEGKAYYCSCTLEELKKMRDEQIAKKLPPKYDGRCRQKKNDNINGCVIRFKMPSEGKVEFNDAIRGNMVFENSTLDDFVILKASGVPTYNFACVVDDHLMEISHVIRGDDHLSNTPRQIHLYQAFGWVPPVMAHLSMILGPDGTRLSKRHGHTSVLEYRDEGYLPEALVNYLALLGWSTTDSRQIFEKGELEKEFSLEGCSKSPAIFDNKKLLWMNMEYLKKLSPSEILNLSQQQIKKAGLSITDESYAERIIKVEKEKIKLLSDVPKIIEIFFKEDYPVDEAAVKKIFSEPSSKEVLKDVLKILEGAKDFTKITLEESLKQYAASRGIKNAKVFHPVRVAVSGRMEGPGLFDLLELLGRERVLTRIKKFLSKI